MFTKWVINNESLKDFRFAENKTLWKLPFIDKNGKNRAARLIKQQAKKRWILNGKPWSERQLKKHLILDPNPIELFKNIDLPF